MLRRQTREFRSRSQWEIVTTAAEDTAIITDVSNATTNLTMHRAMWYVNAARIRAITTAGRCIAIHVTTAGIMVDIVAGMATATNAVGI